MNAETQTTIEMMGALVVADTEKCSALADFLDDVFAKYETFGTADALALHLESRGVKAYRAKGLVCALAIDVTAQARDAGIKGEVIVGCESARISESGRMISGAFGVANMGPVATELVKKFDQQRYPELESDVPYRGGTRKEAVERLVSAVRT